VVGNWDASGIKSVVRILESVELARGRKCGMIVRERWVEIGFRYSREVLRIWG